MDVLRQKNPLSDNDQIDYYNKIIVPSFHHEQPSQILFSYIKKNKCIGYGGFVHISWGDNRAEISFLLDNERALDKVKYAEDFLVYLKLIRQVGFIHIKFNRLYVETFDIREHHIALLEKSGFKIEGRMCEHNFVKNEYVDSIFHACLRREYER